jgi:hypothetical protein
MMATKTTTVLAIAILLSFTAPITIFAEDEKSDHHDDDHDNEKYDDYEKHSAQEKNWVNLNYS